MLVIPFSLNNILKLLGTEANIEDEKTGLIWASQQKRSPVTLTEATFPGPLFGELGRSTHCCWLIVTTVVSVQKWVKMYCSALLVKNLFLH